MNRDALVITAFLTAKSALALAKEPEPKIQELEILLWNLRFYRYFLGREDEEVEAMVKQQKREYEGSIDQMERTLAEYFSFLLDNEVLNAPGNN